MTEKQLKRLIKQYTKARDEIIKKILSVKSIGTKVYYNTVLKEINRIIKKLSKQTHEVIETEIPYIYRKALEELYGYFTKNNLTMLPPNAFAQIHEDAVYDLVKEAEYHTDDALARVGRQVQRYLDVSRDEKLRQAGLKASAQKIATTSTIIDMQNSLEKELKSEGFMTVQYGSGKNAHQVPVETYVAMVARSTTREAGNIARENQLTANGYDLVKMTEHYPTCAVCSALQGRVFSISGKDTRFRPLSDAFSSGYRNVHSNCRHAIGPWIERGYSPEEVEAESQKSLAPLDDVRSSEERELYNKQQRQNREARQNYFQWKRYKERLGDDAPKSQLALERIKKKGGQEWEELQRKYRAAGVDKAGESGIMKMGKVRSDYIQKAPDFSKYNVVDDPDSVIKLKSFISTELHVPESEIDISKLRNVEVAKPFMEQLKKVQTECGLNMPRIVAADIIDGDECCIAGFKPFENTFYISSRYFNSKDALHDTLRDWAKKGFMPEQCTTIKYVAEHEAAHIRMPSDVVVSDEALKIHRKRKLLNDNDADVDEYFADAVAIFRTNQSPDANVIKAIEYLRERGVII